jgi:murein DD-endopeptidase MepM/ murein hydrolase activator NlpD
MLRAQRSSTRAARATFAAGLGLLVALALAIDSPTSHAASQGQLQRQLSAGQGNVSSLQGQVSAASGRLSQLNSNIGNLEAQISRIQADLDAKRGELIKLELQLKAARRRLAQLQALERRGESSLSSQLVNTYESDRPDLMTVVLESTGFKDLLERISFAQRIQRQDVRVVAQVRRARRLLAAQAVHLGSLEVRQQRLTEQVLHERDSLAGARLSLVGQRLSVARERAAKAGALASARNQVAGLQTQLNKLQAQQAARAAAQSSSGSGSGASSGSSRPAGQTTGSPAGSSGGFTFPLPKDAASPPATWSPDEGVDISAPGNTPEFAVCSGTIVLHGIGGFGPWAPVLHCDSPIDGYSYVYYGHAGPDNQLAVGTHVGAGQVMSSIGPGIVGISTGPHLELGFADAGGSPVGSQSAGTMLSLLQASY